MTWSPLPPGLSVAEAAAAAAPKAIVFSQILDWGMLKPRSMTQFCQEENIISTNLTYLRVNGQILPIIKTLLGSFW